MSDLALVLLILWAALSFGAFCLLGNPRKFTDGIWETVLVLAIILFPWLFILLSIGWLAWDWVKYRWQA